MRLTESVVDGQLRIRLTDVRSNVTVIDVSGCIQLDAEHVGRTIRKHLVSEVVEAFIPLNECGSLPNHP